MGTGSCPLALRSQRGAKVRFSMRVGYIASSPFSGSTLLAYTLGAHREVINAGELSVLPRARDEGTPKNCGCGAAVNDCDFWQSVLQRLPHGTLHGSGKDKTAVSIRDNAWLFHGIAAMDEQASVVLDSSKSVERLERLLADPRLDISVIHLVRDGRAVAASKASRSGLSMRVGLRQWSSRQRQIEALLETVDRASRTTVRYEDFVDDPDTTARQLFDFLQLNTRIEPRAPRSVQHYCAGNGRFEQNRVIRPNLGFMKEFSRTAWWLLSLRRFRSLSRYQYPVRRGSYQTRLIHQVECPH